MTAICTVFKKKNILVCLSLKMSCLHRGPYVQRGTGIGSTLTAMFKSVLPAMKIMGRKFLESPVTQNVLKTAKRSALEAGLNVAKDTLRGRKVGESLVENVSTAKKAVTDSLLTALDNAQIQAQAPILNNREKVFSVKRSRSRVKVSKGKGSRKGKRKTYGDIFDVTYQQK